MVIVYWLLEVPLDLACSYFVEDFGASVHHGYWRVVGCVCVCVCVCLCLNLVQDKY